MAGEVTEPLPCGRDLNFFHTPEKAEEATTITEIVQGVPSDTAPSGLEFIRTLDRSALSGVIMAPSLASLVFVIIWLSIYLRKTSENEGKVDTQVVVTTAFTIAIYLVTTGKRCKILVHPLLLILFTLRGVDHWTGCLYGYQLTRNRGFQQSLDQWTANIPG